MFRVLFLLLPGLIPSWSFFRSVEPSPRVQWRVVPGLDDAADTSAQSWQEYRPRPQRLSPIAFIARLFWNPVWNETLFMVSLAERLSARPDAHSLNEIRRCLKRYVGTLQPGEQPLGNLLQFRLVFVHREGGDIVSEVTYLSKPCPLERITS